MGTSWDDTSKLCLILCCPEPHHGKESTGAYQTLIFDNNSFTKVRVSKGTGAINLSKEVSNEQTGEDFATTWTTTNVSEEEFPNNAVSIHNLTNALDSRMRDWNQKNPDNPYTDKVIIDRSLGLLVHLFVPSEQFGDLLKINWRERYLELTLETTPSVHNVKFPLPERDKNALREGRYLDAKFEYDIQELVIKHYDIAVKEIPPTPIQEDGLTSLRPFLHLFRFLSGK